MCFSQTVSLIITEKRTISFISISCSFYVELDLFDFKEMRQIPSNFRTMWFTTRGMVGRRQQAWRG